MELRNPLTRAQLDRLRPRPLVAEFTHTDFPGPVLVGVIPATHVVRDTVVEIQSPFDGGVTITVGDAVAQGRLQTVADNRPQRIDYYNVNNVYEYSVDTEVYVYFPSGTPTQGRARVVIFVD